MVAKSNNIRGICMFVSSTWAGFSFIMLFWEVTWSPTFQKGKFQQKPGQTVKAPRCCLAFSLLLNCLWRGWSWACQLHMPMFVPDGVWTTQKPSNNHQRGIATKIFARNDRFSSWVFNPFGKKHWIYISQTGSFWQGLLVKIRNSFKPPPSCNTFLMVKKKTTRING